MFQIYMKQSSSGTGSTNEILSQRSEDEPVCILNDGLLLHLKTSGTVSKLRSHFVRVCVVSTSVGRAAVCLVTKSSSVGSCCIWLLQD